jgi:2-polyprenyl-3-methyl-5-hydroxy-6-metoxy-1,4-benzoquinol methylase
MWWLIMSDHSSDSALHLAAGRGVAADPIVAPQAYLLPVVHKILDRHFADTQVSRAIIDLGCGNGFLDRALSDVGYAVSGIDVDPVAIARARMNNPHGTYFVGSVYDELVANYGTFPAAVSLEVIEHLYDPHAFAHTLFDMLDANGVAVISTPYHGYIKNVVLSLSGMMDRHYTALWRGGHIKFWSIKTITALLQGAGFTIERVFRVGRLPPIARSMVIVARRPPDAATRRPAYRDAHWGDGTL